MELGPEGSCCNADNQQGPQNDINNPGAGQTIDHVFHLLLGFERSSAANHAAQDGQDEKDHKSDQAIA
jgi:hypothetical protein